jgi:hypothetical protein
MDSLPGTKRANEEAVIREFTEAVNDGNLTLAARIAAANPDLFPPDVRAV